MEQPDNVFYVPDVVQVLEEKALPISHINPTIESGLMSSEVLDSSTEVPGNVCRPCLENTAYDVWKGVTGMSSEMTEEEVYELLKYIVVDKYDTVFDQEAEST